MLPFWFIFVASGLRLIGGVSYLAAVIRNRAKPHPLSWLLWSITPMIAFAAELSAGVGWRSVVTLTLAITPFMVFVATMIKRPKSLTFDLLNVICLLIALFGIVLWMITANPLVAIIITIIADLASSTPAIRKLLKKPEEDFAPTYIISAVSMTVALLTITDWTVEAVLYPLYVLAINVFIATLILKK